ncbi:hypothetical protein LCGC14_0327580 [marine sediment metagenome]
MDICLVIPPSTFLMDERVFPSLGVLKIAAVLEAAGKDVGVLDLSGVENYLDALDVFLAGFTGRHIGITATTPQMPAAHLIAKRIREVATGKRIILGGPHVTLVHAAARKEKERSKYSRGRRALDQLCDLYEVLSVGDGEAAIFEAIGPCRPPKIIDADDRKGPLFQTRDQYAASPFPARHLIDLDSYSYEIEGHRATSLISQLGCPFNCGFCGGRNSSMLRVIRTRPVATVIDELTEIHEAYGYTGFMFYDDELNVNEASFLELLDRLTALQARLGTEFRLRGFIKAELFNEAQARAMYAAGFRWLLCGFEGADDRILTNINKRATIEDNTAVIKVAHKHGLKVKALMSIGHPGESRASVLAVRDWLIAQEADDFDVTIITPYPGSPYHDEAVEQADGSFTYVQPVTGDRLHMREVDYNEHADYYKGMPGEYVSLVHTDGLSEAELVALRDQVEAEVREALGIPFSAVNRATKYEHSMGQGLSDHLLRSTPEEWARSQTA